MDIPTGIDSEHMARRYNPRMIAFIMATAIFMVMLDSTVISIALPQMAQTFRRPPVDLSIGITIYIVVMAAFTPISSWLADRLGARLVLASSIVAFALASVICGLSQNLWQFTLARVLQALPATLLMPVSNLVLLRTTEKKDLVTAMAIATTPALVAPMLGPAVGGFIVTFLHWPWIFYLNVPIAFIGVLLTLRYIPTLPPEPRRPFDWPGFVLTGSGLTALLYGLDRISSADLDRIGPTALLAIGAVLCVFALRHSLRVPHPLLPLTSLRIPTYRNSVLTGGALVKIPFRALGFIMPLMFQVGLHMSAFQAGLLLLAYNGGDLLLKAVASKVIRRVGFRRALISTSLVTAVAPATWMLFDAQTPFWIIFGVLALAGAARSILLTGVIALTYVDVPHAQISGATILNTVMNQVIGAFAISISAIILNVHAALTGAAHLSLADCRVALVAMIIIGLGAVPFFVNLPNDAGAVASGHRSDSDPSVVAAGPSMDAHDG